MSNHSAQLPALGTFLWRFFMQPIRLHDELTAAGIERPNDFSLRLWFAPLDVRAVSRAYVLRMWGLQFLLCLVAGTLLLALYRTGDLRWPVFDIHTFYSTPYGGVLIGSALALLTLTISPSSSFSFVLFILAVWAGQKWNVSILISAVLTGSVFGFLGRVASASTWPLVFIQLDTSWRLLRALSIPVDRENYQAFWICIALMAAIELCIAPRRIQYGWGSLFTRSGNRDIRPGATVIVWTFWVLLFCLSIPNPSEAVATFFTPVALCFRCPIWLIETIAQTALFLYQRQSSRSLIHYSPIYFDQLCYYPLPFLAKHIYLVSKDNPALARDALENSVPSPGISHSAIFFKLQKDELIKIAQERKFEELANLTGFWMNVSEDVRKKYVENAAWRALREAASGLLAAEQTTVAANRLRLLERASEALTAAGTQAKELRDVVTALKEVLEQIQGKAQAAEQSTLRNPFCAGQPLGPERGAELFRGREEIIRQIELHLADADQSFSLALIGPRRSGKTSLLKMLSVRFPDTVTVFFDLQDNPIDTPQGFFSALSRQAYEQALQTHRIQLPRLGEGPPFEAASEWLRSLDMLSGDTRILFCLDEFECLERIFPGDRRELEKLMGLLRATIQHRKKVRLLVSGASPFDELERMWSHYFINVREVTLDLLDRRSACELLSQPRTDFPAGVIPSEIAEAVFLRTGGQPFLIQLFGTELISILNREGRPRATATDVETVEENILTAWAYYFRDTFYSAPAECRSALRTLAETDSAQLSQTAQRWLRRRCLITEGGKLRIPILGHWIRTEDG